MSLPLDSAARKRVPMFTGLRVYFPDALAAVAAHSFINNEKHNPGEPCHWSREKSNDHMDCIDRHMTDIAARPGDLDNKVEELKAIAWRALAELQLSLEAQRTGAAAEAAGVPLDITAVHAAEYVAGRAADMARKVDDDVVAAMTPDRAEHYGKSVPDQIAETFGFKNFRDMTDQPAPEDYNVPRPAGTHAVGEIGACDCPICISGVTDQLIDKGRYEF